MLEGLVEQLVRDGHEVTVLCASGGYAGKEKLNREERDGQELFATCHEVGPPGGGIKAEMGGSDLVLPTSHQLSTLNSQPLPSIIRLRASRFGRGTFIGKLLDYASFYVGVAWKLLTLHPAPDRIIALTTPPFLSVLARLFSKIRGADHAHWVMDLYPDVMAAHGMLGEESTAYRVLARLARWGFGGRRCAAVVTLGPDMAERVRKVISHQSSVISKQQEGDDSQPSTINSQRSVEWVPLWGTGCSDASVTVAGCSGGGDGEWGDSELRSAAPLSRLSPVGTSSALTDVSLQAASALRAHRGWGDGELIVMYSGNMGLGHRFGEILTAAKRVKSEHRSQEGANYIDSSPCGMNESRDESRGPVPSTAFSNSQPSTFFRHPLRILRRWQAAGGSGDFRQGESGMCRGAA